jgi:predicted nucleotidyltransferase
MACEAEKELARRFTEALRERLGERLLAVALFGSVARGEATPDSDIDLLVVVSECPSETLMECLEVRRQIEPYPLRRLSPLVTTPEQLRRNFLILLDIAEEGLILHDPQKVLAGLLAKLRERLRQWGSRKVRLPDGTWYWQRKPDWRLGEVLSLEL